MRLASTGLMAEHMGAEVSRTISAAGTVLRVARNVAGQHTIPDQIVQGLEQMEGPVFLLGEQLDAMEPLYAGNGSEVKERLDVRSTVQHVATVLAFSLQRAGTRLTLRAPAPLTVRMGRDHLLQVLMSLFDNALYWLQFTPQDRRPEVCVQFLSNPPGFRLADSGAGVQADLRDRVFQPFFTGRGNGRGLGLYLAKSLLESDGFSIELSGKPVLLPGANFRILSGKQTAEIKRGSSG
ncbi:Sensor protein FixL [Candidatus Entotheonellaceae bacterium PAL068K]